MTAQYPYKMTDFVLGTPMEVVAGSDKGKKGIILAARISEESGLPILLCVYDCGCVDDYVIPESIRITGEPAYPFTEINQKIQELQEKGEDVSVAFGVIDDLYSPN